MSGVVSITHVREIRVYPGSSPAGVSLLRKRGRLYNLTISYPHYNMTVLRKHITLADAAFSDLRYVIFYRCRRGIREMDTCCIEHLNH